MHEMIYTIHPHNRLTASLLTYYRGELAKADGKINAKPLYIGSVLKCGFDDFERS